LHDHLGVLIYENCHDLLLLGHLDGGAGCLDHGGSTG
jgi:hypothetical protein